eukprot:scpid62709/ scgid1281/ Sestrin-1
MSKFPPDTVPCLPHLSHEDTTIGFFFGLRTDSKHDRKLFIQHVLKEVRLWMDVRDEEEQAEKLLQAHLPTILRLSHECPFEDVQDQFSMFLHDIQKERVAKLPRLVRLGPSAFIQPAEVAPLSSAGDGVRGLFVDAFLNDCRVSHMVRLMGDHPAYLNHFVKTHHFMMRGDGPLPLHWRNYIGTMAGARHYCGYLISLQQLEFAEHCQDKVWMKDMGDSPKKLQNLGELNKILAHQPWLVEPSHMEELLKPGKDSWSMSELVHAIVVMTHFHALAGFALGCGLNPEVDTNLGHTWEEPLVHDWSVSDAETISPCSSVNSHASTVVMATPAAAAAATAPANSNGSSAHNSSPGSAHFPTSSSIPFCSVPANGLPGSIGYPASSSPPTSHFSLGDGEYGTFSSSPTSPFVTSEASQEKLLRGMFEKMSLVRAGSDSTLTVEDCQEQFECESLLSCELEPPAKTSTSSGRVQCPYPDWIERFVDDPEFSHEDFALRGEYSGITSFRYFDYSWEGHGCSLVNRLFNDVGVLLDEKFKCISTMTYNTFGDKTDVDTLPMRRAIWNYIHCIGGIFHDDY